MEAVLAGQLNLLLAEAPATPSRSVRLGDRVQSEPTAEGRGLGWIRSRVNTGRVVGFRANDGAPQIEWDGTADFPHAHCVTFAEPRLECLVVLAPA